MTKEGIEMADSILVNAIVECILVAVVGFCSYTLVKLRTQVSEKMLVLLLICVIISVALGMQIFIFILLKTGVLL